MTSSPSITDVQDFWNTNPLFQGELDEFVGTPEWFQKLDKTQIDDVFVGDLSDLVESRLEGKKVLEVGCGPGFLSRQICRLDIDYTAIDIAPKSIELARKGQSLLGLKGTFLQGNAERLAFPDETFDHVVSIGVIHHTVETQKCIDEFYRVMKKGGTGTCAVYYKNWILRNSFLVKSALFAMKRLGLGLKGRGRDKMHDAIDANDLVRIYDGFENPIGKSYTIPELKEMFSRFEIQSFKPYFFPARALRIRIPKRLHKLLARTTGLMIQIKFSKPELNKQK